MGAPLPARKSAEVQEAWAKPGDDSGEYAGRAVRGLRPAERIGRRQDSAGGHSRLSQNSPFGDHAGANCRKKARREIIMPAKLVPQATVTPLASRINYRRRLQAVKNTA